MVEITVYTRSFCPYCIKAKMLLKSLNQNYKEVELKTEDDMQDLIDKTGMMTVPQIFIDGNFIGGCDDLFELKDEGKLKSMIES